MKKILTLILALSLIFSFALFMAPAAFADGNPQGTPAEAEEPATVVVAPEPAKEFTVAKHPTDETIPAGGKAIFMAYPEGTQVYTVYWTLETDDGDVIEAENAPNYFSGLVVEFPDKQRIRLTHVPENMSGMKVRAHFAKMNGETIESNVAYLFVEPGCKPVEQPAPCVAAPVSTKSEIVITKHPLDELCLRDGQSSTFFTSYATGYSWISWEFKIGDNGGPFSAEKAVSDYHLSLEGINSEKITIRNISWGINGWYIRAVFHDECGNVKYSNWAFMRLVECAPAPCKPCTPCVPCEPCIPALCVPDYPTVVIGGCAAPQTTVTHSETHTDSYTTEVSTTYYGCGHPCWP